MDEEPSIDPMVNLRARLGEVQGELAVFCREHAIERCDLFGSVLREDFGAESDVDVLVTFRDRQTPSLFEHMRLEKALSELFRRQVDLISMGAVSQSENELLRDEILETRRTIYAE